MQIINGKAIADEIGESLTLEVLRIKKEHQLVPTLAVILVGDDPASAIYVDRKVRKGVQVGINVLQYRFPASISSDEVIATIDSLNRDDNVHGILIQLPLPQHLDQYIITNRISFAKDVDGFTTHNIGLLHSWRDSLEPCTPQGVMILLQNALGNSIAGSKAVVIGRSTIVGRPLGALLLKHDCTVVMTHSRSRNVMEEAKSADILVSAMGRPQMIDASWIKKGSCVIDVGITRIGSKIYGDVNFQSASEVAKYITPVPGGVGPMTVICMLRNTVKACLQQIR
ncbi:bifunctional 5,10-methylenetetrahydrofolate dehydrogenase/5,10-methenyltetrahydrofolate cyclohydrolase [Rickettsiales endosymbiont of Peranema trichophorum]|uniref:bifunctional 5,10-methylenetetrahydrofolate dehydrogenase/5,10-methenyltetrahydrofolate cyclohydrolase n=1 Tax=Rickettsiales endosymbiont of Peranema trichophorum TaxID=2486577 RepID=UPI001022D650|nr:bifunctional 5,10-methylenetetrahydrofolate dehydrogenase/5,10-methenyltetrahydrofolate cyclohydrolase [Rickettsiales endosymbiont of Peranema trichophorum]RZI46981.1 bifunctional 5,10-methylenetetrahydrofolate dehydrogenase/5,10-methenyltetrahydrofolate cyclohydrolase [Rickettsiales endosymbiont of Peranema trichophorum]